VPIIIRELILHNENGNHDDIRPQIIIGKMKRLIILLYCVLLFVSPACFDDDNSDEEISPENVYLTPEKINKYLKKIANNNIRIELKNYYISSNPYNPMKMISIAGDKKDLVKPCVLFVGAIHGNEQVSVYVVLKIIEMIVDDYNTGGTSFAGYDFYFIPVMNSYGLTYSERLNINGVDLNRNFPFAWNIGDNSGNSPADQEETRVIMQIIDQHNINLLTAYHTGNVCISFPWDYIGTHNTSGIPEFYSEQEFVSNYHPQYGLYVLSVSEYSKLVKANGISSYYSIEGYDWYPSYGTLTDWAYAEKGILSYTVELHSRLHYSESDDELIKKIWTAHKSAIINMMNIFNTGIYGHVLTYNENTRIIAENILPVKNSKSPKPYKSFCRVNSKTGDYIFPLLPGVYKIIMLHDGIEKVLSDEVKIEQGSITKI